MNIHMSGHHVDITDGIREAVDSKFAKVQSHYPDLGDLSMALTVERHVQAVEVTTQFKGAPVAVHAEAQDLYAAIADAAKKLDAALAKRKGSTKSHRHSKPELVDNPDEEAIR
ncbi:ribosome hibernation-promoting factor, HPF/YfiA family [Marinimicrobium sp. C2-29]|uniref:ribosome hibernation-promoting factor, HPF/YfiA family n=1 Tax=Marinimicrobium sp. C2-29 TaxID=3139825 RepID=UPI00313886A7